MTLLGKKTSVLFLLLACTAINIKAQTDVSVSDAPVRRGNFRYSQNPKTKSKTQNAENQTVAAAENHSDASSDAPSASEFEKTTVAKKTLEIARRASSSANLSPTEIYKIGVGDVLFISLQNAPAKDSTYFTVLSDGTIDYPLAGEMVAVAGLTSEEIEDSLREKVKLYENPQISVKVRENASHPITVLGLVEKSGEKFLQREAVPLYVIKAEAVVASRADSVAVKRADSQTETFDLRDQKSDDVLIFPGDIVEFKAAATAAADGGQTPLFYFIGGEITSAGQKDFHAGLSLTQAILACGGVRKAAAKKAVIRRKNEQGLLSPIQFDLNAIRDGKQPDPILQAGDTVEIVRN